MQLFFKYWIFPTYVTNVTVTYVMPFSESLKWNVLTMCTFDFRWKHTRVESKAYMKTRHTNIQKSYVFADLVYIFSENGSIMYNSMESWHPWRTWITVKGSDRRLFILILDSILVYATLIIWMNLSPYPNLCKANKIKSTLRI